MVGSFPGVIVPIPQRARTLGARGKKMKRYLEMRFIMITVLLLLSIVISAQNIHEVYYQVEGDSIWFPNTTSRDSKSIIQFNNDIYFPIDGGLAKYNLQLDSLFIYQLPVDSNKTKYGINPARIRSIVQIENDLWIGIPNEGIWIFDLINKHFTKKYELEDVDKELPYANLKLFKDPYTKTIWISCVNTLMMFEPEKNQLTNWRPMLNELGIAKPTIRGYSLFDIKNVWFITAGHKFSKGALIKYDKTQNKMQIFRKELCNVNDPKRVDVLTFFKLEDILYAYISNGSYFPTIAEYNKQTEIWQTYNPSELLTIIKDLRNNLSVSKFSNVMKTSFFIRALKDLKIKYTNRELKKVPKAYFNGYSEEQIDSILLDFESDVDFDRYQWQYPHNNSESFLYNNQLVLGKEEQSSMDFTNNVVKYLFPLAETENGILIITNRGLEILNPNSHTLNRITGSEKFHFGRGETKASYDYIEGCIYIFQIVYGHDDRYYLVKFNLQTLNFEDITPVEGIYYHYKKESVWSINNELYVNTHKGLYKYNNKNWENSNRIIESKKTFKSLPSELTLRNGSKVIVNNSGLFIIKNPN